MDLKLRGLKALITGGSKGIGYRCAAALGAQVSICARTVADVDAVTAELGVYGAVVDVSNKNALESWVADSAVAMSGIDIVIGNVSALAVSDDEAAWEASFNTDMMHCVRLVNAAMPWLEASDAASITLVSSVSGREIDFTGPAYGAFKAALVHYAQGLAYKLAPQGIRANTIETGNPELFATALAMNPMGRMATPDEIARGVIFLASPASSFTSGTNLVIDGALTKGVQL
jgi:3-oxoacyl-[acyl-carrier protein] reductase